VYAGIERARREGVPILGTCGGFQHMVVEYARNAAGITDAGHAESDPDAGAQVIAPLQCSLEGEERVVRTVPGTLVARLCGEAPFVGFHWCNYGVEPAYLDRLVAAGMVVSATATDAGTEALELPGHPFYVGTLFQPQVGSSESGTLHPLIAALVRAAGPPS
jgi:CTP synthase (UTP-ammonia lyase)